MSIPSPFQRANISTIAVMVMSTHAQSGISLGWMLVICDGPMRSLQPTHQSAMSCSLWVMAAPIHSIPAYLGRRERVCLPVLDGLSGSLALPRMAHHILWHHSQSGSAQKGSSATL